MAASEEQNLVRRLRRKAHKAYSRLRSLELELADAQRALAEARNEVAMAECDLEQSKHSHP